MMKRAWLILADTLIILLLLGALSLYILSFPPTKHHPSSTLVQPIPPQASSCAIPVAEKNETNTTLQESNDSITLESLIALSQEVAMQEYLEAMNYQEVSLEDRLRSLHLHKGDPLYIRIFKKEALLEVWMRGADGAYVHVKDYAICAYSGHLGPKLKEGDRQAPEGFYRVYKRQLNPHSRFYLSFNLGYPNAYDSAHHRTGSYLMVHGDCRSIGCYAMTNRRIKEIYALVEAALEHGQAYVPVHIFPFRMDDEMMDAYSESRWYDFWMELKEGYDYFEAEERPPLVEVRNGEYVILEAEE